MAAWRTPENIEYESERKTAHMNPGWASSECAVCNEKLKHPRWKISRCTNRGQDYDGDRLAPLAIALRGLDLCGDPFPVGASPLGSPWRMDTSALGVRPTCLKQAGPRLPAPQTGEVRRTAQQSEFGSCHDQRTD